MYDVCGELSFHVENDLELDAKRIKHLQEVLACYLYVLEQKGWHHLNTWIPPEMEKEIKFAESFGFQKTGIEKVIYYADGREQHMTEMRINF